MSWVDNLIKLDMIFTLGTSAGVQDSAQFGIHGQLNFTPADDAAWNTALGNLAQFAASSWSTVVGNGMYSNGVGLLKARAARNNTLGHTLNEAIKTPATAWTGAAGTVSLAWATTVSVGLYTFPPGTFVQHAARKRGRVYLPPMNTTILTDAKSGEPSISNVGVPFGDFMTWLLGVKGHAIAASEQVWTPGVASNSTGLKPAGDPSWAAITHLKVDNKLDTQRRRERQQLAVSAAVPFTP